MYTEQDLDLLISEQSKFIDIEISADAYSKIIGQQFKPGDRIKITWAGKALEGIEDEGYLFQLPNCDDTYDMLDFFVHVRNPDNSSGIGPAPQVFTHLVALLENKLVKSIKIIPQTPHP